MKCTESSSPKLLTTIVRQKFNHETYKTTSVLGAYSANYIGAIIVRFSLGSSV
jgi:predicted transcriptional regulator